MLQVTGLSLPFLSKFAFNEKVNLILAAAKKIFYKRCVKRGHLIN